MTPRLLSRLRNARSAVGTLRLLNTLTEEEFFALRSLARWGVEESLTALRMPQISDQATISPTVSFRFAERIEVGPRTNIGPFAAIWGGWSEARIRIGSSVMIGQCCTLVAGHHLLDGRGPIRDTGFEEADVTIGDGAMVSAGSAVLGCNVGTGAVVGAGAVVTRDVPDFAIAVGVPARIVGERPPG